jgi:hypothetical protein
LPSTVAALPVPAEPPNRLERPVATEASPAPPAVPPAATNQAAFPPVQPVDAPSAAPQPASTADAAKKAVRQAQIAAIREAKRRQRALRPAPYSIRDFFASTR